MRPFCIATIGTILGIIMGLYSNSIVSFIFVFLIIILCIMKINFIQKYKKIIFIFIICFLLFNIYTFLLEQNYKKINKIYNNKEIEIQAIVISDKTEKEYKDVYKIKVINIKFKNHKEKENFNMILNIKKDKNQKIDLHYGDKINFIANYEIPSYARNEGRL